MDGQTVQTHRKDLVSFSLCTKIKRSRIRNKAVSHPHIRQTVRSWHVWRYRKRQHHFYAHAAHIAWSAEMHRRLFALYVVTSNYKQLNYFSNERLGMKRYDRKDLTHCTIHNSAIISYFCRTIFNTRTDDIKRSTRMFPDFFVTLR
jgi:hypothetical protein